MHHNLLIFITTETYHRSIQHTHNHWLTELDLSQISISGRTQPRVSLSLTSSDKSWRLLLELLGRARGRASGSKGGWTTIRTDWCPSCSISRRRPCDAGHADHRLRGGPRVQEVPAPLTESKLWWHWKFYICGFASIAWQSWIGKASGLQTPIMVCYLFIHVWLQTIDVIALPISIVAVSWGSFMVFKHHLFFGSHYEWRVRNCVIKIHLHWLTVRATKNSWGAATSCKGILRWRTRKLALMCIWTCAGWCPGTPMPTIGRTAAWKRNRIVLLWALFYKVATGNVNVIWICVRQHLNCSEQSGCPSHNLELLNSLMEEEHFGRGFKTLYAMLMGYERVGPRDMPDHSIYVGLYCSLVQ